MAGKQSLRALQRRRQLLRPESLAVGTEVIAYQSPAGDTPSGMSAIDLSNYAKANGTTTTIALAQLEAAMGSFPPVGPLVTPNIPQQPVINVLPIDAPPSQNSATPNTPPITDPISVTPIVPAQGPIVTTTPIIIPGIGNSIDLSSVNPALGIPTVIGGVTIVDGNTTYTGNVDLGPTLERIQSGHGLNTSGDGTIFRNDEDLLPTVPGNTYTEYLVPTPSAEAQGRPGPQRVVVGSDGAVYYTPDHYGSFISIGTMKRP